MVSTIYTLNRLKYFNTIKFKHNTVALLSLNDNWGPIDESLIVLILLVSYVYKSFGEIFELLAFCEV